MIWFLRGKLGLLDVVVRSSICSYILAVCSFKNIILHITILVSYNSCSLSGLWQWCLVIGINTMGFIHRGDGSTCTTFFLPIFDLLLHRLTKHSLIHFSIHRNIKLFETVSSILAFTEILSSSRFLLLAKALVSSKMRRHFVATTKDSRKIIVLTWKCLVGPYWDFGP